MLVRGTKIPNAPVRCGDAPIHHGHHIRDDDGGEVPAVPLHVVALAEIHDWRVHQAVSEGQEHFVPVRQGAKRTRGVAIHGNRKRVKGMDQALVPESVTTAEWPTTTNRWPLQSRAERAVADLVLSRDIAGGAQALEARPLEVEVTRSHFGPAKPPLRDTVANRRQRSDGRRGWCGSSSGGLKGASGNNDIRCNLLKVTNNKMDHGHRGMCHTYHAKDALGSFPNRRGRVEQW